MISDKLNFLPEQLFMSETNWKPYLWIQVIHNHRHAVIFIITVDCDPWNSSVGNSGPQGILLERSKFGNHTKIQ